MYPNYLYWNSIKIKFLFKITFCAMVFAVWLLTKHFIGNFISFFFKLSLLRKNSLFSIGLMCICKLNSIHNKIFGDFHTIVSFTVCRNFYLEELSKWIKQIHRRDFRLITYDIIKHYIQLLYLTFPQHKLVHRNNGTSTSSRRKNCNTIHFVSFSC